jgi:nitrate reductase NapE component
LKIKNKGKQWVIAVRKCLMYKLLEFNKNFTNCDDLKDFAFKSHVDCYLNPGDGAKSFCSIFLSNKKALYDTIEFVDLILEPLNSVKQVNAFKFIIWFFFVIIVC